MILFIKELLSNLFLYTPSIYANLISIKKNFNYEKYFYLKHINHGDIVFFIGANIGYFSKISSILCGRTGCVYCFEPIYENFLKLKNTLKNSKNVKLYNFAVGDENCIKHISYDPNDCEKSSFISNFCKKPVLVQRLDDFVELLEPKKINLIKCDVEGFELHALLGMKKTLIKYKPVISLEISVDMEQRLIIYDFLKSAGYKSFHKIELNFPKYNPHTLVDSSDNYFYLYASY